MSSVQVTLPDAPSGYKLLPDVLVIHESTPRQDPLLLCRNYSSAMQDSASAVGQRPRYQCSSLSLPFHSRVHSTAGILLCCGVATPFSIYMRVHSTAGNLLCCGVATPLFKVCPRSAVCCTATM